MVLNFESVHGILRCDSSNKTSSAVLSHRTIHIYIFHKMEFGIFLAL